MERRMLMVISDKSSDFASVQRRAMGDATTHFENACIEKNASCWICGFVQIWTIDSARYH